MWTDRRRVCSRVAGDKCPRRFKSNRRRRANRRVSMDYDGRMFRGTEQTSGSTQVGRGWY